MDVNDFPSNLGTRSPESIKVVLRKTSVMIATRVSAEEQRLIRAAASLDGEKVTDFLRRLAVPAAMQRLEMAAREGFVGNGTRTRKVTTQ
jgi:hypothetical protein